MVKKVLYVFGLMLLTSFLVIDVVSASEASGTLSPTLETGISGTLIAAPTISPAAGTYTSTQSVTLTAAGTTGICYTANGTTPVCSALGTTCTTGTLYASAISVSSSQTITAISCYSNNRQSSTASAAYTISTSSSSGGGGGGVPAQAMPSTTNGSVIATASLGGETSLTGSNGTKATVKIEKDTLTASTAVAIESVAQTSSAVSGMVAGIGTGQTIVGNLYNYTATVGSTNLTTFTKAVTITMTYTDAQIQGLDENSLKIYYWDTATSKWIALSCTIDKVTNTITATTTHFTYFSIIGGATGSSTPDTTTPDSHLVDGDIVRASNAPGMEKFDVYIVKLINSKKYRRLVLSPHVFDSYQHLKWSNLKIITNAEMLTYTISDLVRCNDVAKKVNDPKVYRLYPDGDTGAKRWMNMSASVFSSKYDWDAIYIINQVDRDAYTTGTDLTS
ncbi:MAG: chitobiase/beta-hexosaminidase C-terminal domain-containing protein [Candidatus Paceibacterota bacterium]|jgi:hypothetical protein